MDKVWSSAVQPIAAPSVSVDNVELPAGLWSGHVQRIGAHSLFNAHRGAIVFLVNKENSDKGVKNEASG